MPIITKPVTITKGQANIITLVKADLAANAKVIADSYFSNQANWKRVILDYQTPVGNQVNSVIFDAEQVSPEGNFNPSDKARDGDWEVRSLTIIDFDGGYLKLLRGDLTVAEFDIVIGIVGGGILIEVNQRNTDFTYTFDTEIFGQSFTLANPTELTKIALRMHQVNGNASGTLTLRIKNLSNNNIEGSAFVNANTITNLDPNTEQWIEFNFGSLNLATGQYLMELEAVGVLNVGDVRWAVSTSDIYAGGETYYLGSPYISTWDANFRIYSA
jgi:hypothetical protein